MNITPRTENHRIIFETFRELWQNHVIWTELYINALVTGVGNLAYYNDRMYENIEFFEETLRYYYGDDFALSFSILMRNHILVKIKFLVDYQKGDMAAAEADRAIRNKNIEAWSELLSRMNPYWDGETWRNLFLEHDRLTEGKVISDITYRISNPELEKAIQDQIIQLAEYMANGIIRQFNL